MLMGIMNEGIPALAERYHTGPAAGPDLLDRRQAEYHRVRGPGRSKLQVQNYYIWHRVVASSVVHSSICSFQNKHFTNINGIHSCCKDVSIH